jgi:RimJ/RimL family protein N-acetyltransferase
LAFVSFWLENAAAKQLYERCGFRADARDRRQRRRLTPHRKTRATPRGNLVGSAKLHLV